MSTVLPGQGTVRVVVTDELVCGDTLYVARVPDEGGDIVNSCGLARGGQAAWHWSSRSIISLSTFRL